MKDGDSLAAPRTDYHQSAPAHPRWARLLRWKSPLLFASQVASEVAWLTMLAAIVIQYLQLFVLGILIYLASVAAALLILPLVLATSRNARQALRQGGPIEAEEKVALERILRATALAPLAATLPLASKRWPAPIVTDAAPLDTAKQPDAVPSQRLRLAALLIVLGLTAALMALTTKQALTRYRELNSGWSWDLAYYNQWFWALTQGDGKITARPAGPCTVEGPSVWIMNYLSPVRFAIVPVYKLFPGPETLLVVQNLVFWLCIPAIYGLVREESDSQLIGLSAASLVPLTPLLWPLVWNDFRELQLAVPFVIWGVHGYRSRSLALAVLGIGGMLACRQEFALLVASLAILPPRRPEPTERTYRWARFVILLGVAWMFLGYFGYVRWVVSSIGPELYLSQFEGPKARLGETLETAFDFLFVGLGSWVVLSAFAPRAALLAVPWVWSLSNGRWALRLIATEQWHHVRYAAPLAALVLAAGAIGYSRIARWLLKKKHGRILLALVWALSASGLLLADTVMAGRLERIPRPVPPGEVAEAWRRIGEVKPDDGVLAAYCLCAPLSSRACLYSYVMPMNVPARYPRLDRRFTWIFTRRDDLAIPLFTSQGFRWVYRGPFLYILHRDPRDAPPDEPKLRAPSPRPHRP